MGSIRGNRLRQLTRRSLSDIDRRDQNAFNRWLNAVRMCKTSQQIDLPSSQIPTKMSLIWPDRPQLFVVIDTCSIVAFRCEFIDFVVNLKRLFPSKCSPVRFIISLTVLGELDKCNRSKNKKQAKLKSSTQSNDNNNNKNNNNNNSQHHKNNPVNYDDLEELLRAAEGNSKNYNNVTKSSEPPRMFMRFLEEEMRMSDILIGELDPHKLRTLNQKELNIEILTKDDKILECCLRSRAFISSHDHHSDTSVILVTEDNIFKSKATTFEISSYRWREFAIKYRNFGLNHYVTTPSMLPSTQLVTVSQQSFNTQNKAEVAVRKTQKPNNNQNQEQDERKTSSEEPAKVPWPDPVLSRKNAQNKVALMKKLFNFNSKEPLLDTSKVVPERKRNSLDSLTCLISSSLSKLNPKARSSGSSQDDVEFLEEIINVN